MSWLTGTATDIKDLLSQIKEAAEDEGWTTGAYTTGGAAPRTDTLYLEGPGYGDGYECFFGIRTYEDAANNHYCLELRGMSAFDSGASWDAQPGVSPTPVIMRLWNANMVWWASISDRRIILIVKCSNTYHSMYAGFFNPFANPVEYPYPMYIASDSASYGPFGALDYDTRAIAFPGRNAAFLRDTNGMWRSVCVYNELDGDYDFQEMRTSTFTVWPYLSVIGNADNPGGQYDRPPYARLEQLPGVADSLPAMNCYIMSLEDLGGIQGVLEGVYWIPGNTLSAEQQVTLDGETYRVFVGISRSIESPNQFYAVKEA